LLCERRGQISPTVWFLPEQAKERFAFATNTVTKTKIVSEQRGAGRSTGSADASVHEVTGPEAQHRVPLTDPQRESADAQPTPRTASVVVRQSELTLCRRAHERGLMIR
jgi:hypothetical protein